MIPTSPAANAAIYILRQSIAHRGDPVHPLVAQADPNPDEATAEIGEDRYFGMNSMDITAKKVHLMERLGDVFGIEMDEHPDARSFAMTIRGVVEKLRTSPEGQGRLIEVERDLGLDDLGISIDTLIGAMTDPAGDDARTLDEVLRAEMGETLLEGDDAEAIERLARMGLDEAGLYGI